MGCFLKHFSPPFLPSGLLAIAWGSVITKVCQEHSNSFLSLFSSSVLSPNSKALPCHIKPLLKTFSGPYLHIKSNILYELVVMNFPRYILYATPVVTGAWVTHTIHWTTNISYNFLTLCLSHDAPDPSILWPHFPLLNLYTVFGQCWR